MTNILVEWAVMAKMPGAQGEYSVLASSKGGLDRQAYKNIIRKWLTGEMPTEANSYNPAAPWYLFGVEEDPLRLVALRQEWCGYADSSNRPVRRTTCLMLPYAEIAPSGCGFSQMAEFFSQKTVYDVLSEAAAEIAARKERFDYPCLKVKLPEPAESLDSMKKAVKNREAFCERAASALLNGKPLGLLQPGGEILPWEERLSYLDAALALLPYGYRAASPASTWASSGVDHPMWLYWGRSARPGHSSLPFPPRPNQTAEKLHKDIQIIHEIMQRGMSIEETLSFMLKQTDRLSFDQAMSRDVLDKLGGAFSILLRLRNEAPITPQTLADAVNTIETDVLAANRLITAAERNEFITLILPQMEPKQIGFLTSLWNPELEEFVVGMIVKKFESMPYDRLESLQIPVLLLLRNGKAVELFSRLWELRETDGGVMSRFSEQFTRLLQFGLQGENEQPVSELISWAVENCLSVPVLFHWAEWVVSSQPPANLKPIALVLPKITDDEAWLISALKCVIGISSANLNVILEHINVQDAAYELLILIGVSAVCNTIKETFSPISNKLIGWLKEQKYLSEDFIIKIILDLPELSPTNLFENQWAELDEMRLLSDQNSLALPELLNSEPRKFSIYQDDLEKFLNGLLPNLKRNMFSRLYQLSFTTIPGNDYSLINLDNFCRMMQKISQDKRWDELYFNRVRAIIIEACRRKSFQEDLARFCRPILSRDWRGQESQDNPYWIGLIDLLSSNLSPMTGAELWKLVSFLGCQVDQTGQRGVEFENLFHRFVISNNRFLSSPNDKEFYKDMVCRQANAHLEFLGELTPFMPGVRYKRDWLRELKQQYIPWLERVFKNSR